MSEGESPRDAHDGCDGSDGSDGLRARQARRITGILLWTALVAAALLGLAVAVLHGQRETDVFDGLRP